MSKEANKALNKDNLLAYITDLQQLAEKGAAEGKSHNEYFQGYAKALAHVIEKIEKMREEEK